MATPRAERRFRFVGDTSPALEGVITEADGQTIVPLTGYAAVVSFWTAGAEEPHVMRAAKIHDAANGVIRYYFSGDEWTPAGEVYAQVELFKTLWGSAGVGRDYYRFSSPILRREVRSVP